MWCAGMRWIMFYAPVHASRPKQNKPSNNLDKIIWNRFEIMWKRTINQLV